jgi:hypothetical protein
MDEKPEDVSDRLAAPEMLWPDVPRFGFSGSAGYFALGPVASVEWAQRQGMHGYVEGYRRAAETVFETVAGRSPDYAVWPLVFLWRHHLELAMKDIIAAGRAIDGEATGFPTGHDLLKLWREAKPHIQNCGPKESPELRNVEASITEFQDVDPGADGFRYPVMRNNPKSRSLPNAPAHVNLATLQEAMLGLSNFFSAVRSEQDARLDYISDTIRDEQSREY